MRGDAPLRGAPWAGILALFVFALALWAQPDAMVGVFFDDGIYVQLAKALAEGDGYRSMHLPGAPPAVHYPPLYPLALAALWRLWPAFPANVTLFQLFDAAALAWAAWLIARHARLTRLPGVLQVGALALGFAAFPLLTLVGMRFAEPLFLALAAGAVLVADDERPSPRKALAAGALAGLATLARSIGIAVIGGVVLALWLRRRRREAVAAAVAAGACVLPWLVWVRLKAGEIDPLIAANYGTYGQFVRQGGVAEILASVSLRGVDPFPRLLLPDVPAVVWWPLAALVLAALAWGGVVLARRTPALVAALALYVITVALWPYAPDRFMWIVAPWAFLFGAAGLADTWRRGRAGRIAVAVLGLAMLAGYGRRQALSLAERRFARPAVQASVPFQLLTAGIATGTPPDAVVASDGEALIYLYTGRRTVPLYLFRIQGRELAGAPADTTAAFLCARGVTHVGASWRGGEVEPLFAAFERMADSALVPLFHVTNGPVLYRFTCPG